MDPLPGQEAISATEQRYMRRALDLARRGEGRTRPNPAVGALVVDDGLVVGEGFHPRAGEPHAEIFALRAAGPRAVGAELYVTLEPCCHTGRTPPCTRAILAAGIRRVVVGTLDPNPLVAGRGCEELRRAGVEVVTGVCEADCRYLIAPFAKHVRSGLPHVTLKAALTLDGQIATATGQSQWITGPASRERAHRLRDRSDAILVGIETVLADNPRLTTRLAAGGGEDPLRVVLDSRLRTPPQAAVLQPNPAGATLIATTDAAPLAAEEALRARGAEVVRCGAGAQVDLARLLKLLGERGVQSLLLEGGGRLNHAFWQAGLVDRVVFFLAPLLLGGVGRPVLAGAGSPALELATRLGDVRVERVGDDILIEGEVGRCSPV